MIKLSVHESVEAALQKAFPKPPAAAKRALTKYISVVESMLFDALQRGHTPEQRKLGLYSISLDQLANKGGQIGPKKIRVHKWLTDNDWDIVQTVVLGTKFSGQNSLVKLTALATIQNSLQVPVQSLAAATTDEEIDAYLNGDDVSNIALFDHLYPEYNLEWREDKLNTLFDWVSVDVESVKAYVYWLEAESKLIQGPKKDLALRQSLSILGIASVTKGVDFNTDVDHFFPHKLKQSNLHLNLDGVWNLVLSCQSCNRGVSGKFDRIPSLKLLERLHTRNEFLIGSHHPLRETLINQTGDSLEKRVGFLSKIYQEVQLNPLLAWEPEYQFDFDDGDENSKVIGLG